ncbi:MAG: DUF6550 family protein [Eubacteriales bacterium]
MTKKTKFATALLATALLSNGFTLDHEEEVTTVDPEPTAEVIAEKESTPVIAPQHLVAKEEILVEVFDETPMEEEGEALYRVATETEPQPTEPPPQATTLDQTQADTTPPVSTIPLAEQTSATREPTINIPEPDSMNGIDFGTSLTIQPDIPTKPVYTEEQLSDPSQKPDGSPVEQENLTEEIFIPEGATVIYHYPSEEEMKKEFYVPGFGWVKSSGEPNVQIIADDMYTNGNKVGTMGG